MKDDEGTMNPGEYAPIPEEEDDIGPGPAPEPDEDVSAFIERALAPDEDEDG